MDSGNFPVKIASLRTSFSQCCTSATFNAVITEFSESRVLHFCGLNVCSTIPISLNRLEEMGLIKKFKNGIQVFCDEYVALVQHYESLDRMEKETFTKEFADTGIAVLQKCNIEIKPMLQKCNIFSGKHN